MPSSKQRREAERRRLQRRVQRRVQRDARRRRFAVIASIVGTLVVIAIVLAFVVATGNDNKKPKAAGTNSASSAPTATTAAAYPCNWQTVAVTPAKPVSVPPTTRPPRSGKVDLLVRTSRGAMTFQLDRAAAPCAVENFVSLAEQQYFNASPCHRLTSGTLNVLQCGDPKGTGTGGPGYEFKDELTGHERYTRGVIAMANGGPDTNGSQFFIVYRNSTLKPNYTIFGRVTSGLGVVDKVAAKGATPAGKPKLPITITSVSVVQ